MLFNPRSAFLAWRHPVAAGDELKFRHCTLFGILLVSTTGEEYRMKANMAAEAENSRDRLSHAGSEFALG